MTNKASTIHLKKLTPVLIVDAIEPCLDFWTRLGLGRTAEVPHGDALGFVILAAGGVEIMYQTRASVRADMAALGEMASSVALYIEVSDLDAVVQELGDAPVVVPRRTTFYGAHEIGVRAPCGNVVTFAQVAA